MVTDWLLGWQVLSTSGTGTAQVSVTHQVQLVVSASYGGRRRRPLGSLTHPSAEARTTLKKQGRPVEGR